MNSNAKIGLFGTGLDTYWGQFDGLLDELKGYQARIRDRMERDAGVQVADAGMVDSPARALEAASLFVREQVDLVFLYMAPTVCRRRSCPSCSGSTVRWWCSTCNRRRPSITSGSTPWATAAG